jgi:GNAT superfamily N-acetyltransferase
MSADEVLIHRFEADQLDALLALTVRAWAPVFPLMEADIPAFVYRAFYPEGWEARQRKDVAAICQDTNTEVWVAMLGDQLAGYVGLRAHEADSMGEVHILAVDPAFQRRGIGRALLDFSCEWIRQRGLSMAFVETGGDRGHAPSRATYESAGFERYPVARYFRAV